MISNYDFLDIYSIIEDHKPMEALIAFFKIGIAGILPKKNPRQCDFIKAIEVRLYCV